MKLTTHPSVKAGISEPRLWYGEAGANRSRVWDIWQKSALSSRTGLGSGHIPGEMKHGAATGDICVERIKRAVPKILKILVHTHSRIVLRETFAQSLTIGTKFIGND